MNEYTLRIKSNVAEPGQWFVAVADVDNQRPPFAPERATVQGSDLDSMIVRSIAIDHIPVLVGNAGVPASFLPQGQFASDILTPASSLIIVGKNEGETPTELTIDLSGPLVEIGSFRFSSEETNSGRSPERLTHKNALEATRQLYESATADMPSQPTDQQPG